MPATSASAGTTARMRSPMTVWRRMKSHSSAVSDPGLVRIEAGIATLPMSCSSAARRTWAVPHAALMLNPSPCSLSAELTRARSSSSSTVAGASTQNSSPPSRAAVMPAGQASTSHAAKRRNSASPAGCP